MTSELLRVERAPVAERVVEQDQSLTMAILELVADVASTQYEDLPPLYESADPDALEMIFARSDTGLIAVSYYGYVVCLTADRTLEIYEQL